jgi:hypothetical protein
LGARNVPDPLSDVSFGWLPLTTPARTAVDLARALPFRDGVIVADSAFRLGATMAEMQDAGSPERRLALNAVPFRREQ